MKNNFNLNIFFNELRNKTLSGNNVDIEDIINKANGNKDFIWKGNKKLGKKCGYNENDTLFFNPLFAPLELIFPILDKSLRCDHIFSVFTDLGKMADYEVCIEYVYLSSSKKEISFIIGLENGLGYLVKMFKAI